MLFPSPGVYLTGALVLPSHLVLTIPPGATVLGSPDEADYPTLPPMWSVCGRIVTSGPFASPLVGGRQVSNVSIRGGGVLDGGGYKSFMPRLVQFQRSQNIHIQNMTMQRSGMWTVHFYFVVDASVTDSRIINPILQSQTDGVDIDSSANVYIARNFIQCGDDGVVLKSGSDWCGRQWATPTVNVTIEHNYFNFSGGQLAFGSDMSGGIRDVLVQHNTMHGDAHRQPHLFDWGPRVIVLKTGRGRGGVIENVMVLNTTCIDCDQIVRISYTYVTMSEPQNVSATPVFRNITIRGVHGTAEEPGFFRCVPETAPVMHFEDIDVMYLSNRTDYVGCGQGCPLGTAINAKPPVCDLQPRHTQDTSLVGCLAKSLWLDAGPQESIHVDTTVAARTVPVHFLSYTHDSYFMVADLGMQPVWNDSRLLNMVGALAPSIVRVGGGDMDYTEMDFPASGSNSTKGDRSNAHLGPCPPGTAAPGGYLQLCGEQCPKNCVMNSTTWAPFLAFANTVGVHVVAGLNALDGRMGNASRPWDPSRARDFLRWCQAHYPDTIVAVELGNEPRAFGSGPPGVAKGKATDLRPEQLAADVAGPLHDILRELGGNNNIALWGPDVDSPTDPDGWFRSFLSGLHVNKTQLPPLLQAATYHQYYNEENPYPGPLSMRLFTDVKVLDSIVAPLQKMVSIVKELSPHSHVIMGETSSFAGEGAGTASDTFAAIFTFLDKLAIAAITGHDAVFHQTILDPTMNSANQHEVTYEVIKEGIPNISSASWVMQHGSYSPTPNFWTSVLWKALMGTTVLHVANSTVSGRTARIYAHCTSVPNTTAATRLTPGYSKGAVTVMVLNIREFATSLLVPSSLCTDADCSRDEYHLSPGMAAPPVPASHHNCTVPVPPCCRSGSCPCTAKFTVAESTSSVHGQELPPRTVVGATTAGNRISFLGNFSNWTACMENAGERYMPFASSFTWFDSSSTNALACFAHRDGVWQPSSDTHAVSGKSNSWQPGFKPCTAPSWPKLAQETLSVQAKLNDRLLVLQGSERVPRLEPVHGGGKRVTIQPYTAAWFVFEANAKACLA